MPSAPYFLLGPWRSASFWCWHTQYTKAAIAATKPPVCRFFVVSGSKENLSVHEVPDYDASSVRAAPWNAFSWNELGRCRSAWWPQPSSSSIFLALGGYYSYYNVDCVGDVAQSSESWVPSRRGLRTWTGTTSSVPASRAAEALAGPVLLPSEDC